jgi:hypothetical protein
MGSLRWFPDGLPESVCNTSFSPLSSSSTSQALLLLFCDSLARTIFEVLGSESRLASAQLRDSDYCQSSRHQGAIVPVNRLSQARVFLIDPSLHHFIIPTIPTSSARESNSRALGNQPLPYGPVQETAVLPLRGSSGNYAQLALIVLKTAFWFGPSLVQYHFSWIYPHLRLFPNISPKTTRIWNT